MTSSEGPARCFIKSHPITVSKFPQSDPRMWEGRVGLCWALCMASFPEDKGEGPLHRESLVQEVPTPWPKVESQTTDPRERRTPRSSSNPL